MIRSELQLQTSSVSNRVLCIQHGHSFDPAEVIVNGYIHPVCGTCLALEYQGLEEEPAIAGEMCAMDTCMENAEAVPCKMCGKRKCILHMWASGKDALCKACMAWSHNDEGDSKAEGNAMALRGQCSAGDCSGEKKLYFCKSCDSTYCFEHMWYVPGYELAMCLFCHALVP